MEQKGGTDGEESFEALEKQFQLVLTELLGDKSVEKFRTEYEKITGALRKAHESEKRLMSKCRELNAEIVSNSTKVETALKLSQEDEATIRSLKKELENAWKTVDAAHDKEIKAKENIITLKQEISRLTQLAEQGAGLSEGQEHSVNNLKQAVDELTGERDELVSSVERLRDGLAQASATQQQMEAQIENSSQAVSQLQQELQVRQNELSRETRQKEKLEKEVKQLHADAEAKTSELKALSQQGQRAKDEQQRLEQQLKELKVTNERSARELEQMQAKISKLQQDNEQQSVAVEQHTLENQQKANELRMKEEELNLRRQEIAKLTKAREAIQKKSNQMEDQKGEAEVQRETLKTQLGVLERELEVFRKQAETEKKAAEELARERDMLNKNLIKVTDSTGKQQIFLKLQEQAQKNLEQEVHNYREEAQKQQKIIHQLEKDRDRYINETSGLRNKVQQHTDDLKVNETEIAEYKKKTCDTEQRLASLHTLYEKVVAERNLYSKNLVEIQDEIAELKRKLKFKSLEIEQLKEEISGKEATMSREHQDALRVERDNEGLKAKLQLMKQQAEETRQRIDGQKAEERQLQRTIAEADAEAARQKKELDQVYSELEILGSQMLCRNDQLRLLHLELKTKDCLLAKTDFQYSQRLEDIRLLKLDMRNLSREKSIQSRLASNAKDLRRELFHIHKELLQERRRFCTLEEQLRTPMNVHHWRKLEANDPEYFELIQKAQDLQKALVTKNQEVMDKDLLLKERERVYLELKELLARQPGPEAFEQLQQCQRAHREKTKKFKALTAELNMYESKIQEYKSDNQVLINQLQDIKKKYLSLKQQQREEKSAARTVFPMIQSPLCHRQRFTGGGFSLSAPANK
ncbi:cilia- and flagella-associated protein 58 [Gadus morhua]|uniref:Cilia and flagella associated protein 58 n=2 Tax=Gadus morhua TaxID=8049 RepID=A0A8C5BY74_GADMO|nr:cilia- and flagella-associated protein 58 [Gadus morhua]